MTAHEPAQRAEYVRERYGYTPVGDIVKRTVSTDDDGREVGSTTTIAEVWSCLRCGALVHRIYEHDKWHARIDGKASE